MQESRKSRIKAKVRRISSGPGVYLMKDRFNTVLYIGKAKNLKKRVSTYFQPSRQTQIAQPKIVAMIHLVYDLETIEVPSEAEALLLEGKLIKEYRPRYNTDFTDNKQFLLVRVDVHNELPRFRLTRNRLEDNARYFGPFAHSGLLRQTLVEMRLQFGILLNDARPQKLTDGRWQLYDDARAEIYRQTDIVTQETYAQRVSEACDFLDGKSREWLANLKDEMATAAKAYQFERAAELRDIIEALSRTIEPSKPRPRRLHSLDNQEALKRLKALLKLTCLPAIIECFDISHISGEHVVASMVRFVNGKPDKRAYRRFRIRSFVGNDDYRAMEEVVGRRYGRLHKEGRSYPNLIVIDGGLGQVHAAQKAFLGLELTPPFLIGLAKREETIVFAEGRLPLQLPRHDPGLQLLQRLRDEAHRFANRFNATLRSRKIRESVLDEFGGIGPVKRRTLMERFQSIDKLRQASLAELTEVDGIGPKTAKALKTFLEGLEAR